MKKSIHYVEIFLRFISHIIYINLLWLTDMPIFNCLINVYWNSHLFSSCKASHENSFQMFLFCFLFWTSRASDLQNRVAYDCSEVMEVGDTCGVSHKVSRPVVLCFLIVWRKRKTSLPVLFVHWKIEGKEVQKSLHFSTAYGGVEVARNNFMLSAYH